MFLERADKSAELLRSILFAAGSAGLWFVLQSAKPSELKWHSMSAVAFLAVIITVYWSWDLQKRKARRRYEILRDEGVVAYVENENVISSNRRLDLFAFLFLLVAALIEVLLKAVA